MWISNGIETAGAPPAGPASLARTSAATVSRPSVRKGCEITRVRLPSSRPARVDEEQPADRFVNLPFELVTPENMAKYAGKN